MTGTQGPARTVTRRTVVTAVGGAGLAVVALSACGSADDDKTATEPGSGQADGGTAGAGGGKVIAQITDIPEGGGKVIGDLVVTQPIAGEFKAFSSKCTHTGCAVKGIADGVINCPCHGSKFDVADGSVKAGPATTPLPPTAIAVDGNSIRLA